MSMDIPGYLRVLARAAGKEHLLDAPAPEVDTESAFEADVASIRIARRAAFVESLPPLYAGMTFDSWIDRPAFADSAKLVKRWAEEYPLIDAGLFLFGRERGTGKTHLALAAGRVLADKGCRVRLVDVVALLSRIRNGFEDKQPRIDVEGIGRWCDALILDDLGAERQTEWVSEQLYLLVNTAIANQAALIVTSNLDYEELEARMDDRVVSRIIGATDKVDMNGPDFRLEQHKKRRRG